MTYPRSQTISQTEDGHYHIISRCVRKAFLLQNSENTGETEKYNCRKAWIRSKVIALSKVFYIDVCGYALMDTHMHLVLGTRYFEADKASDRDIATRWLTLHPAKRRNGDNFEAPTDDEISTFLINEDEVEKCRKKLRDISYFMKELNQYIARRANKEDGHTGRFWEGRFESISLPEDAAILKCLMYVELNPIRAGIAKTPETSEYTSCYDRIQAEENGVEDEWLASIFNTEQKEGFLHMTFSEYLDLLDWTGREIRADKRGAISSSLAPILERIGLKTSDWASSFKSFRKDFRRVAATEETIRKLAKKANKKWFHGVGVASRHFTDYQYTV